MNRLELAVEKITDAVELRARNAENAVDLARPRTLGWPSDSSTVGRVSRAAWPCQRADTLPLLLGWPWVAELAATDKAKISHGALRTPRWGS